jgi:hypothetical protein
VIADGIHPTEKRNGFAKGGRSELGAVMGAMHTENKGF